MHSQDLDASGSGLNGVVLYPCQAARVRAWGAQLPEVLANSFRTEMSALFQLWGRRIKWVRFFRLPAESSTGTFAGLLQHFVSRAAGVAGEHEHISRPTLNPGVWRHHRNTTLLPRFKANRSDAYGAEEVDLQ